MFKKLFSVMFGTKTDIPDDHPKIQPRNSGEIPIPEIPDGVAFIYEETAEGSYQYRHRGRMEKLDDPIRFAEKKKLSGLRVIYTRKFAGKKADETLLETYI